MCLFFQDIDEYVLMFYLLREFWGQNLWSLRNTLELKCKNVLTKCLVNTNKILLPISNIKLDFMKQLFKVLSNRYNDFKHVSSSFAY